MAHYITAIAQPHCSGTIERDIYRRLVHVLSEPGQTWAKTPSLRHAFSELDNVLNGEKRSLWVATVMHSAGQNRLRDYPIPDELEY